jgi:hypothetical protein
VECSLELAAAVADEAAASGWGARRSAIRRALLGRADEVLRVIGATLSGELQGPFPAQLHSRNPEFGACLGSRVEHECDLVEPVDACWLGSVKAAADRLSNRRRRCHCPAVPGQLAAAGRQRRVRQRRAEPLHHRRRHVRAAPAAV